MNLKMFGCLGKERPMTELKDSNGDVVLMLRPNTERVFFSF